MENKVPKSVGSKQDTQKQPKQPKQPKLPKLPRPVRAPKEPKPKSEGSAIGLVLKPWHFMVICAVGAALIMGGVWLGTRIAQSNSGIDSSAEHLDWTPPTGTPTDGSGITLPGYTSITFPAGARRVEVILPNPTNNPCYFRYTLTLKETGEQIYQSGLIPPGMAVTEIKLSHALKRGDYTLHIEIETFSLTDRTPMNGGTQDVPLSVR